VRSYGKNGDQASDLYEFDGFEGSISKGSSRSAKYEFLVEGKKGLNDLVIQVTPSWYHASPGFKPTGRWRYRPSWCAGTPGPTTRQTVRRDRR
jgi:hypothetical protein